MTARRAVGVGLGALAAVLVSRALVTRWIERWIERTLREMRDGTAKSVILAEAAQAFASPGVFEPCGLLPRSTRGVVIDSGGGQVGIMVDRGVVDYPTPGTPVAVVETGTTTL